MARLGENRYGKSRVRLSRITRHDDDRHEFNEWTVHVMLYGDFEASLHAGRQQQGSAHRHDEEHRVLRGARLEGRDHRGLCLRAGRLLPLEPAAGGKGQHRSPGKSLAAHDRRRRAGSHDLQAGRTRVADCTRRARKRRRVGRDLGRRWTDDSQDDEVGVHRLHQGQADHAQAGHRPHLRHARHGHMGICGSSAGLCRGARANSRQHC